MPDSESNQETAELFPKTVGDMLREARVARNMDLAEVAARTRIPQRHLEAIEQSDFSTLPSKTYGIGFVKAYARAVGADEVAIARALRAETDRAFKPVEARPEPMVIQPRRAPTGGLMAVALIVLLIAAAGAALYFGSSLFRGAESPPDSASSTANELGMVSDAPTPAPSPTPTAIPVNGQVTLTATDQVWVRIYDATGKTLMEKTLAPGERYDVPMDADNPMINIGRPDQLTVTINGSPVAPLGGPERAIKDVGISAAALLARGQPTPIPSPSASTTAGAPAPVPSATQRAPQSRATPSANPTPRPSLRAPAALLPTPKPTPKPYTPSPAASVAVPPPAPVATAAP